MLVLCIWHYSLTILPAQAKLFYYQNFAVGKQESFKAEYNLHTPQFSGDVGAT